MVFKNDLQNMRTEDVERDISLTIYDRDPMPPFAHVRFQIRIKDKIFLVPAVLNIREEPDGDHYTWLVSSVKPARSNSIKFEADHNGEQACDTIRGILTEALTVFKDRFGSTSPLSVTVVYQS